MNLAADRQEILRALELLVPPDGNFELRAPKTKKATVSGYYASLETASNHAVTISDDPHIGAPAIYITVNPVLPDLLARSANQFNTFATVTTQDAEIVRRIWLLIDCDPVRPAGISATEEEHAAALARAQAICEWLTEQGWPMPVSADSGNGGHLLYRIDLPNDNASTNLLKRVLKALASRFDDALVIVDQSVFNAARICKLYGTVTRKGSDTPTRPHRMARILWNGQTAFEVVTVAQLEAIAGEIPLGEAKPQSNKSGVCELLTKFGLVIKSTEDPFQGETETGIKYVLEECPFHPPHKDCAVFNFPSGPVFSCFHDSCADKTWRHVCSLFEYEAPDLSQLAWRGQLILGENGKPKALVQNAKLMLRHAPEWQGVLGYNEFSLNITTLKPPPWPQSQPGRNWADDDDTETMCWLQVNGILINSSKIVREAVQSVAKKHSYHPVKTYLSSLCWDKTSRLLEWTITYLGAKPTPLNMAIGQRWLISAVARIMCPGCKADFVLLLEGPQGIGKSTALETLASPPWFTDHLSDLGSKDSRIELHGKWIIELGEFVSRRSELERKAFLTACADNFRAPYERTASWFPRSNVFAATTNDPVPLTDETGGRRYWPVTCGRIDLDGLRANRDQLWAEAFSAYQAGEPWWDDFAEFRDALTEEQESRYQPQVWDEAILAWLENPQQRDEWANGMLSLIEPYDTTLTQTTIADVLTHCLGKSKDKHTNQDQRIVRACLLHAKWSQTKPTKVPGTKRVVRFFTRPQKKGGVL
jgi:predicted P-loop ATPase